MCIKSNTRSPSKRAVMVSETPDREAQKRSASVAVKDQARGVINGSGQQGTGEQGGKT